MPCLSWINLFIREYYKFTDLDAIVRERHGIVMKNIYKKLIFLGLILSIFLLVGCDKIKFYTYNAGDDDIDNKEVEENIDLNTEEDNIEKDNAEENNDNIDKADDTDSPTTSDIKPKANIPLLIYTINADSGQIEPVTAMISDDEVIDADLIVDKVVEAMADKSIQVGIESISTDSDKIIISFYSDQPPLTNVGAGIELAILDAIGQSLIDNLPDYNIIIYQVEKEAYKSGHIILGIDEAYFTR